QELADDLRRYLSDRPILARRPSLWERLQKWARRHRTLVFASIVLLFMAAVASGVVAFVKWREQAQTELARADEARQRAKAEANFELARRAVDDMYTQVAERWLAHMPGLTRVQMEFLQKARQFYEEFSREDSDDPKMMA